MSHYVAVMGYQRFVDNKINKCSLQQGEMPQTDVLHWSEQTEHSL